MADTEQTVKVELTMNQFCWMASVLGATPKNHFRWHKDLSREQWDNMVNRVVHNPENSKKLLQWCDVQIALESEGE